jgi:hypothetical protein
MKRIVLASLLLFELSQPFWATRSHAGSPTKATANGQQPAKSSDIERERLEFEQRQANKDASLRERELVLKEREIRAKEADQKASTWSPLVVAIIAAALGLFGNVIVTFLQGTANRKIAREKAVSDEKLENLKAQSNLILEAIKVGPATAKGNLQFFIEVDLIDEPIKSKIQTWLECHESPSLPPPAPGFQLTFITLDAVTETPIPDAEVLTTPAYFVNLTAVGRTNHRGTLTAQYQPGVYLVVVRAEGYVESTQMFSIPPVTEQVVKLTRKSN